MRFPASKLARLFLSLLMISAPLAMSAGAIEPEEYDRLDGHGLTKKRVDVIEWEGNLEIHVYPKGSLRGLGLKIDRTKKDKPVMVIAYRFTNVNYTLYRRAILSIPMSDSFKVYEETSADDYDKIMISNNTLTANVKPFTLDAAPTQLYPDHYVAGEDPNQKRSTANTGATAAGTTAGAASATTKKATPGVQFQQAQQGNSGVDADALSFKGVEKGPKKAPEKTIDEDGGIRSFQY